MYDDLSKHVVLLSVMEHAVNKQKKKVFVVLVMLPSASEVRMSSLADILEPSLAAVNITSMTNAYCCEYSIKTPDDRQ